MLGRRTAPRRSKSTGARPSDIDLVILDLAMPRLSGPEALLELRVNTEVGVLISSGYSSDEDLRTVERAGVVGFVASRIGRRTWRGDRHGPRRGQEGIVGARSVRVFANCTKVRYAGVETAPYEENRGRGAVSTPEDRTLEDHSPRTSFIVYARRLARQELRRLERSADVAVARHVPDASAPTSRQAC